MFRAIEPSLQIVDPPTAEKTASEETMQRNAGLKLPSAFWSHFAEHHWDKSPLTLQKPFTTPFARPEEIFTAIKKACHQQHTNGAPTLIRFYMEGGFLVGDSYLAQYLPLSSDMTAEDYVGRMTRELDGRRFGLIIDHFQWYDAGIWLRMRKFLQSLLGQIPAQSSSATVFLGNYDKTPLGIHQDLQSIFQFVVGGRKRMYLWPPDYFGNRFDARLRLDFETLRLDATVLEGEPGDVLFWPSNYWHIGETIGGLSTCLSIALVPPQPAKDLLEHLKRELESRFDAALEAAAWPAAWPQLLESGEIVSQVAKLATDNLARAVRDPNFAQALHLSWLNLMSSSGCDPVPPPLPCKTLADDDVVYANPEYPILWIADDSHCLTCSANGYAFTIPADPKIIKLLERLNTGEGVRVKNLIEEYAGVTRHEGVEFDATPEGIRTVLSKLYSLRAIAEKNNKRAEP